MLKNILFIALGIGIGLGIAGYMSLIDIPDFELAPLWCPDDSGEGANGLVRAISSLHI